MAYKYIEPEVKAGAIKECLQLRHVSEVAKKHGIDPDTIRNIYKEKIILQLTELVSNEKPGPKPQGKGIEKISIKKDFQASPDDGRPNRCGECGSTKVWKNGRYKVINWLIFFICLCIPKAKTLIQRYICGECGCPIHSIKQKAIAYARKRGNIILHRLIVFAKFKLRLSDRYTQRLVRFIYGIRISIGSVDKIAQEVGDKARKVIERLGECRQRAASVMLGDETFPKVIGKGKASAKSLALVICEHGLIRAVKAVKRKGNNLKHIFKGALGVYYNPLYFLSDYDKKYPQLIGSISKNIRQLKDIVHTLRIIHRAFEKAIREVTIEFPRGLSQADRKRQKNLKQKLLRKRLHPLKMILFKAFGKGHEPVASLYIQGALTELEEFPFGTGGLSKTLKKFFKKYQDILCFQLEHRDELITTTNALESKNSLLKPFSKQAKSYQKGETCEKAMNGIALMENFDIKERGKNKGTSALQRAEINLDDLGAKDFFEAVGLAI